MGGKYSYSYDINSSGQVVGDSTTTGGSWHAFFVDSDGTGIQDLGTLGGKSSTARAINDLGQIVGGANVAGDRHHAFITEPGGISMVDLGAMNGDFSFAYGVNNHGQAVSIAGFNGDDGNSSFIYSNGVMVNLSQLDAVVDAGWTMLIAQDINDSGQIVGYGVLNNIRQPFLLSGADQEDFFSSYVPVPIKHLHDHDIYVAVPEPQTYAMLLVGLGLIFSRYRSS